MGILNLQSRFFHKKQFLMIFVLAFLIINNINLFAKEKETFTVALTGKYPPFNFYSEKGKLVGFDVDTAKKISKHLNRKLVIIPTEWDSIVAGLLFKKYDAIIGSMAITPERAKKVNFSIPYYISGAQLFIHKKNRGKIKKITDLYGKRVGVGLGETYEHYLRKNHPSIEIATYKSTVDIFMDMRNNRLDGFLTDRLVGLYQIKKGHMPFIPAGQLLYEEKMAIPVTLNNTELLTNINKALMRMKKDGTFTKLNKKWFGSASVSDSEAERDMRTEVIIKKLAQGFAITLFVAFFSILFGFILSVPSGIILNSKKTFLYYVLRSSNDITRGTPLLIQLFFVYFGTPQIGITLTPIQAAIITLTINSSAYMSEVIRSGLMAVDHGQNLAGKALGLTKLQVFRYVIWPQSFRVALPPLVNSVVALMKDTALIAMISVGEVIRETQSIISVTYNPIKYYFIVGAMFFVFTFPLMKMANKLENNIKKRGFTHA